MSQITTCCSFLLSIAIGGVTVMGANCALAQITPDSTLPNNSIVTPDGSTLNITGGTIAGSNLFHSFKEFSVPNGDTAIFNNALDIQNIISRVTGGSVSNIDGLIKANGTANLFLINPSGIIFGRNAQLNLGGSFLASTANAIKFADGTQFSASALQNTPLLTISVPIGLQFGSDPGSIFSQSQATVNQNSNSLQYGIPVGLQVQPSKTLALVGGNVALEGGYLTAKKGRIELGSVGSSSLVKLIPTEQGWTLGYEGVQNFQDIQLYPKVSDIETEPGVFISQPLGAFVSGDDIQVQGRQVKVTDSGIRSISNMNVTASELVEVNGGNISLSNLTLGNGTRTGNLTMTTGKLIIRDGARVSAFVYGGSGGNLTVNALESVEVTGVRKIEAQDIRDRDYFVTSGLSTSTGDLKITTGKLILRDGADVETRVPFNGSVGGNLTVTASKSVEVIGTTIDNNPSIISTTTSNFRAITGDLTITTGKLIVQDGALVSTGGDGSSGGKLTVTAPEFVKIVGTDAMENPSSLYTLNADANEASDLRITTGKLVVQDRAQVATSTSYTGDAGDLIIKASDSVEVSRGGRILAQTGSESTGAGGNLTIETQRLEGTQLTVRSLGKGPTGKLTVSTTEPLPSVGTQVTPDRTLPINSRVRENFNTSIIEDGTRVGNNLFHSFEQFSLLTLSTVYFNNSLDIQNIIARVTGSSASNIDGQIQTNGKANLFLLNPRGIVFGRDAFLNVGGAFLASTATTLNFADSSQFSVIALQTTPTLTMSLPNGLEFRDTEGSIINQSKVGNIPTISNRSRPSDPLQLIRFDEVGLQVRPEMSLALVGGDVRVNNATLGAPGGRVELGGVSGSGVVELNVDGNNLRLSIPNGVSRANVSLSNAQLNVNGHSGAINILAQSFSSTNSVLLARDFGGVSGNVSINADDTVSFKNSGIFSIAGFGKSSGNINIQGRTVSLVDDSYFNVSAAGGNAGSINVYASDSVSLSGKGTGLFATTYARGEGVGNVRIETGQLTLRDGAVVSVDSTSEAKAGNLEIKAQEIYLDNQARLSAETGSNQGGNIMLDVQNLLLLRRGSQISTTAGTTQQSGDGGNITINAPNGFIVAVPNENNDITANAFSGNGGKITINATGIFGMTPRTGEDVVKLLKPNDPSQLDPHQLPTNDITAFSQQNPSLSNTVEFNTPDPTRGIVQLPTNLVDVSQEIDTGCTPGSRQTASSFTITGRGGLLPNPFDLLTSDAVQVGWVNLNPNIDNSKSPFTSTNATIRAPERIVEATGWVRNSKGEIVLTSDTPTTTHEPWQNPISCRASKALEIFRDS